MDPGREEKLKSSAEAVAYHMFGFLSAIKNAAAGLDAGIRSVEQSMLNC